MVKSFMVFLGVLLLGSCSSLQYIDRLPSTSGGSATTPGNKSPYVVFGKQYEVLPDSRGYLEIGIASWYGKKFHGRLTANGETYNMYSLSAAHKSLPLPTIVRVTNLDNGKKTTLRVNDRGPFHDDRVIDLSYKAALELGFADKGTAPVVVEAIDERNYSGGIGGGAFSITVEGALLKAAEGSLLRTAEGSLLKAAEGSLLKAAEGSLLKAAEGSLPRTAEGSLLKAAEGSLLKAAEGSTYFLQAGAFSRVEGARLLLRKIEDLLADHGGGIQVRILESELKAGILHKVWIGPIRTASDETKISMLVAAVVASKPLKIEIE